MPREFLSNFELMVLLALVRLGDEAYGVSIAREIEHAAESQVIMASLYNTLGRLEEKGLVTARMGDPTPERGGRAKRFFHVTAKGRREANRTRKALVRLWNGIPVFEGEPA